MRIIFVSTEFLAKNKPSTGLPNYLYRVSKALISIGHIPIIVASGEYNEHIFYDGIEVYRQITTTNFHKKEEVNYIYNSINSSYNLCKIVNQICASVKVDIIQYTNLYGLALFHNKKIPSVLRLSSYAKVYFGSNSTFSKSYVNVMSFIERLSSKRVTGIISPSNVMAEEFGKDIKRKVTVIETPFHNDVNIMDTSVLQEKIGERKYLLYFGALYAEKGIFIIADILNKLFEQYQDLYFVFVGKVQLINNRNPLKVLYKKAGKYKNRVIYINPLKHEQLYPIIQHAYLVILPSVMENFSNACIEAMYFESIVIGTKGTSFEQLIKHRESGFLAEPNDSRSLLQTIQEAMLIKDEDRIIMKKRANNRIKILDTDHVVKKLVKYYEYIIMKGKV